MSDPERLLDQGSAVEKGLLSAALDEPPPADLLERTLEAVAAAGAAGTAAAAAGAAAKAGVAASATGGGILGALGVGALAGLLTVGAYEVASSARAPRSAPAVVTAAPPPRDPIPAALPVPSSSAHPPAAEPPARAPEPAPTGRVEAAGSARPSTLAAELALLDEARSALRAGDPARARRELERYAREIPRGQLAREAAMLRAEVDAALTAGKTIP